MKRAISLKLRANALVQFTTRVDRALRDAARILIYRRRVGARNRARRDYARAIY